MMATLTVKKKKFNIWKLMKVTIVTKEEKCNGYLSWDWESTWYNPASIPGLHKRKVPLASRNTRELPQLTKCICEKHTSGFAARDWLFPTTLSNTRCLLPPFLVSIVRKALNTARPEDSTRGAQMGKEEENVFFLLLLTVCIKTQWVLPEKLPELTRKCIKAEGSRWTCKTTETAFLSLCPDTN